MYMNNRPEPLRIETEVLEEATGEYRIEVVTSSRLVPDPFALDVSDKKPASLELYANGEEVLSVSDELDAGSVLVVGNPKGLIKGINEFFVSASPPLENSGISHAVRVRVYSGTELIADLTLWSEPCMKLSATFTADLAGDSTSE